MRSAPNSAACARAKAKAFSLAGISEAKTMVEGLLHPGLSRSAIGNLLAVRKNVIKDVTGLAVSGDTCRGEMNHAVRMADCVPTDVMRVCGILMRGPNNRLLYGGCCASSWEMSIENCPVHVEEGA